MPYSINIDPLFCHVRRGRIFRFDDINHSRGSSRQRHVCTDGCLQQTQTRRFPYLLGASTCQNVCRHLPPLATNVCDTCRHLLEFVLTSPGLRDVYACRGLCVLVCATALGGSCVYKYVSCVCVCVCVCLTSCFDDHCRAIAVRLISPHAVCVCVCVCVRPAPEVNTGSVVALTNPPPPLDSRPTSS